MLKSIIKTETLLAPGIYDALSGLIAEQSGAKAVYLSGASIAYTRFGRSDVGLVSVSEVHDTLAAVTDRIKIPIIVDADTGFGNALNVQRTIRNFERAGAAAIQIEDQSFPKRCGHLDGKVLIKTDEMVGKVKAAVDARKTIDTLIIARTDARAVEGLQEAIDRAHTYKEAGADILETNTFNSTKISQKDYDCEEFSFDLNYQGGMIARKAVDDFLDKNPGQNRFVAGVLGPTNRTCSMSPDVNDPGFRNVNFDTLRDDYLVSIEALLKSGVDLILIETIF